MTIALYRKAEQLMKERELLSDIVHHFAELKEQYEKQDISVSEETEKKFVFDTDDILNSLENIKHDSPKTYCFLYEGMKAVIEELEAKRKEVYYLKTQNENLENHLKNVSKALEMDYKKDNISGLTEAAEELKKKVEMLTEPIKRSNAEKAIDEIGHLLSVSDFDTLCWYDKVRSIKAYIKQLQFIGRM